MIGVITGDIMNSRDGQVIDWMRHLKEILNHYGDEPKQWEIFRGDSFQLSINPQNALLAAIHIKASVKQSKAQDVRIAIGIGDEKYNAEKITESNGSAYILSGECFESLKKQTLAIRSSNHELDETLNIMLSLALLIANNWSDTVAKVITTALKYPKMQQKELANVLKKSQSSVSEALTRGGFEEIKSINKYYQTQITKL